MKANEAPEKIYCGNNGHGNLSYSNQLFPNAAEYTRTDAFIEKAALWLEDNMRKWFKNINTHGYKMTGLMIEDFKKAMKGK